MAIYLQQNFSDGVLYEYSKTEKEGFTEHKNKSGVTSYRRNLNKGLYGKFKGVEKRDSNFGDQISITFVDENGNTNYVQIPLFDGQKNISTYAEGFIVNLKGMKEGEDYRIFPYAIENEGSKYTNRGISVKKANLSDLTVSDSVEKYTNTYTKDGEEVKGDIPKVEWVEKMGSSIPNKDAKNEFLYNVLMNFIAPKEQTQSKKTETTKPKSKAQQEDLEDDLPFN